MLSILKMESDYSGQAEIEMGLIVANLNESFRKVRSGKASITVFETICVDYYGKSLPIPQVAALSVLEGRSVLIRPWDVKALPLIEKAILVSNLSLNPSSDGKVLRIVFPPLTEEGRRDIVKQVKVNAEKFRVAIRGVRRNILEEIKKKEANKDLGKSYSNEIQKITDLYVRKIDDLLIEKEQEIMII